MDFQKELEQVEVELRIEQQRGALQDSSKVATLQQRKAELISQATQAEIEEKVHAEGVPFAVSGVDFTKLPAEFIEVIELVIKADRRKHFTEQAQLEAKREAEFATYKAQMNEKVSRHERDYNDLELEYLQAANELKAQTAESLQFKAERDEARTNRDNAVAQLEEANKEIARLNGLVDDYQRAKVLGEREAQNVIEADDSEASAINNALAKLYTSIENWGSINKVTKPDGTFELVKNRDLDQWVSAEGGSETSRGTFPEAAQTDAEIGGVPVAQGTVEPPQFFDGVGIISPPPFQNEVSNDDNAVGGVVAVQEVVGETVTRAEFEALKRDVEALKQGKVGAAA